MPIPTSKGQYRYVKYEDDGVSIYQCLWCLQTIRIADDPQYGWNFCPCCGKSWFTRLQCRDHEIPRWAYNIWGNDVPHDVSLYGPWRPETRQWVFECRTKWPDREWSEWKFEHSSKKDPHKPDWQAARWTLNRLRERHNNDCGFDVLYEYRVRIQDIPNVRFVIKDGDRSTVFAEFAKKYLTP